MLAEVAADVLQGVWEPVVESCEHGDGGVAIKVFGEDKEPVVAGTGVETTEHTRQWSMSREPDARVVGGDHGIHTVGWVEDACHRFVHFVSTPLDAIAAAVGVS